MLMRSSDGMCCYDRLRYRDGGYRFTELKRIASYLVTELGMFMEVNSVQL